MRTVILAILTVAAPVAAWAGDLDGDGKPEVMFLDQDDTVRILAADTGKQIGDHRAAHPQGAERWEHLVVVNLRGKGARDLILQATNADGYRVGRHVAAYPMDGLAGPPLWRTDRFGALAHGPLRVADLDGDGRGWECGLRRAAPPASRAVPGPGILRMERTIPLTRCVPRRRRHRHIGTRTRTRPRGRRAWHPVRTGCGEIDCRSLQPSRSRTVVDSRLLKHRCQLTSEAARG